MRPFRRLTLVLAACSVFLAPRAAEAWDPVETHPAMVHQAALDADLHLRWMDASGNTLGLFTALQLDPEVLPPNLRRDIARAIDRAPAHAGLGARGGPGSCPRTARAGATSTTCVEGERWEATALAWLELGLLLEETPRARLLHHFVDRQDPRRDTWSDPQLSAVEFRGTALAAGIPLAQAVNRSAFDGRAPSAAGWLRDTRDPWSFAATLEHLQRAKIDPDPVVRQRELVLGLLGTGALLHVVQDLAVPAHARGDLRAFLLPLSPTPGDLGLPFQEFVRLTYGPSRLPRAVALQPRAVDETVAGSSLDAVLWGTDAHEGMVPFTASRFFSETSLPAPQLLDPALSPKDAAARLLASESGLHEDERRDAVLRPWPSERGYLETRAGRPLAAFDTDEAGRVRLFLDRAVYRDQAAQLIPRAVQASTAVLDLLFPAFPALEIDRAARRLHLDLSGHTGEVDVALWTETSDGRRTVRARWRLPGGRPVELSDVNLPEGGFLLALTHTSDDGVARVAVHSVAAPLEKPIGTFPAPGTLKDERIRPSGGGRPVEPAPAAAPTDAPPDAPARVDAVSSDEPGSPASPPPEVTDPEVTDPARE